MSIPECYRRKFKWMAPYWIYSRRHSRAEAACNSCHAPIRSCVGREFGFHFSFLSCCAVQDCFHLSRHVQKIYGRLQPLDPLIPKKFGRNRLNSLIFRFSRIVHFLPYPLLCYSFHIRYLLQRIVIFAVYPVFWRFGRVLRNVGADIIKVF